MDEFGSGLWPKPIWQSEPRLSDLSGPTSAQLPARARGLAWASSYPKGWTKLAVMFFGWFFFGRV